MLIFLKSAGNSARLVCVFLDTVKEYHGENEADQKSGGEIDKVVEHITCGGGFQKLSTDCRAGR
tara:strand:+ start:516 stop:707 length:192 start_codon:yes stop_codon:yes gene_type:complete